jgi:DUF1365 family protein
VRNVQIESVPVGWEVAYQNEVQSIDIDEIVALAMCSRLRVIKKKKFNIFNLFVIKKIVCYFKI